VDRRITPADVIVAMGQDIAGVNPASARTTRWISLHNIPTRKDRDTYARTVNGHLHLLSTEPDRIPLLDSSHPALGSVATIAAVRVNEWLIRIDAALYGKRFVEQWERLANAEPYWHGIDQQPDISGTEYEEVEVEYGFWVRPDGVKYIGKKKSDRDTWELVRIEKERKKKPAVKKLRGFGPWVTNTPAAQKAFEVIQAKTGGTDCPVVTAEWLVFQTAIVEERDPSYYDFIGIKNFKDFEKLVGFTKEVDPGFLRDIREAVGSSDVLTKECGRRIVRFQAGGALWFTQDVNWAAKKFDPKASPVLNLGDDYIFDAIEGFGLKSNEFWATVAANSKGELQKSVPTNLASDSMAPYGDRRIHPNLGCIRCHDDGGLKDIGDPWIRGRLNSPPNFLNGKTPDEQRTLRQQYVTQHLTPKLAQDRSKYAAALWEVTGMKPAEFSANYARLWKEWAEDDVTPERACRDLGCTVKELQTVLADQKGKVDPGLASLRLPRPKPIPVTFWTGQQPSGSGFQRAMDALHGVSRPFSVKEK
jgi:hypothetical protein